jgi:glutamate-1-semialdehyde aminotransferase
VTQEPARLNLARSLKLFEEARALIPGGTLGIRRPYNFVEGEFPIFFDSGSGCRVRDVDGNEFIDFLCAYGPIILGYREREVDEAVIRQIRDKGLCFSLTQPFQNELAARLRGLIPCAQMCVFVKTGSDAMTCAVRLARAHTGRTKVLRCGYHGWHDWCVEVTGGIPPKLYEDVHEFEYNDLAAVEALLAAHGADTAAITVTPYGHPLARPLLDPAPGFLEGLRQLADAHGVVLVYDEVRTGFRMDLSGAQKHYGVTPDLAAFGKAMANGYAISALCGRAQIVKKAEREVFISSTFFPNSDGYVAALKTLDILERDAVLEGIWQKGTRFLQRLREVAGRYPIGAQVSGNGPMFFVTFRKDPEKLYRQRRTAFYTQLIRRGIFLQPYHHGYICHRHTPEDLDRTLDAIDASCRFVLDRFGAFG